MKTPESAEPEGNRWRPARNVWALSAVSFLTDASSEIIAPLLPLFLTGTLGASVRTVGVIEGGAEAIASLLKLASGWWSDRSRRRKPLIVLGYSLASLVRPLVAVAQSTSQVMLSREGRPRRAARCATGGVHPCGLSRARVRLSSRR